MQYLLTFGIMLAVGLITGQLTAGLRFQARVATHREERAASLYEIARDLSGAVQIEQVVKISDESIERTFHASAALLLPDSIRPADRLGAARAAARSSVEIGIAQWAFDQGPAGGLRHRHPAGQRGAVHPAARTDPAARACWPSRRETAGCCSIPEQRQLLDTFAALIAIALERVHYVGVAQEALVRMESERLRNSLLAALSHDLRTPLTVLVGLGRVAAAHQAAACRRRSSRRRMRSRTRRVA